MKGSGEPRLGVVYGLDDVVGATVVAQGAAVGIAEGTVVEVKGAGMEEGADGADERS